MAVREAAPDDLPAVATVLDGAMLAVEDLERAVAAGQVLVATDGGPVLGALVGRPAGAAPDWAREAGTDRHVEAVAVRRARRGQGFGRALVRAASERAGDDGRPGRVTAGFEPGVRAFYESLGFEVEVLDDRCRGVRPPVAWDEG